MNKNYVDIYEEDVYGCFKKIYVDVNLIVEDSILPVEKVYLENVYLENDKMESVLSIKNRDNKYFCKKSKEDILQIKNKYNIFSNIYNGWIKLYKTKEDCIEEIEISSIYVDLCKIDVVCAADYIREDVMTMSGVYTKVFVKDHGIYFTDICPKSLIDAINTVKINNYR
jgi:hypothetical protein